MTTNMLLRAAISLNNTGVTLLHRGCYKQALKTLSDSVSVMKSAFHRDASQVCIDTVLNEAAQRLTCPEPEANHVSKKMIILTEAQVIPDHEDTCLMRIENVDSWNNDDNTVYELLSAIVVLNLGIAYQAMDTTTTENHEKTEFLVGSKNLLQFAYTILTNIVQSEQSSDIDPTELRRAIMASIIVLQNLLKVLAKLGEGNRNKEYMTQLDQLIEFVRQQQQGESLIAAPAA